MRYNVDGIIPVLTRNINMGEGMDGKIATCIFAILQGKLNKEPLNRNCNASTIGYIGEIDVTHRFS